MYCFFFQNLFLCFPSIFYRVVGVDHNTHEDTGILSVEVNLLKVLQVCGASEKMEISSWDFSFWDYLDRKFRQTIIESLTEI